MELKKVTIQGVVVSEAEIQRIDNMLSGRSAALDAYERVLGRIAYALPKEGESDENFIKRLRSMADEVLSEYPY